MTETVELLIVLEIVPPVKATVLPTVYVPGLL